MAWIKNIQQIFKQPESRKKPLLRGPLILKGDFFMRAPGSVEANLEGSVESDFHLSIEDDARILGSCSARNLHVFGEINGNLCSREHVRLAPNSVVRGKVTSTTLEISQGADFEGALEIGP